MVALAGCSSGGGRHTGTGDGHCITAGVSVISGRHTRSTNTNATPTTAANGDAAPAPAHTANGDASPTYAHTTSPGTGTNHRGATPSGYADSAGATYPAGSRADDVADPGRIASADPHTPTPSADADTDADTATARRIE